MLGEDVTHGSQKLLSLTHAAYIKCFSNIVLLRDDTLNTYYSFTSVHQES